MKSKISFVVFVVMVAAAAAAAAAAAVLAFQAGKAAATVRAFQAEAATASVSPLGPLVAAEERFADAVDALRALALSDSASDYARATAASLVAPTCSPEEASTLVLAVLRAVQNPDSAGYWTAIDVAADLVRRAPESREVRRLAAKMADTAGHPRRYELAIEDELEQAGVGPAKNAAVAALHDTLARANAAVDLATAAENKFELIARIDLVATNLSAASPQRIQAALRSLIAEASAPGADREIREYLAHVATRALCLGHDGESQRFSEEFSSELATFIVAVTPQRAAVVAALKR